MQKLSTFKVAGRHVLNSWRIMRSEKTLTMYTFENVVFEVLGRRFILTFKNSPALTPSITTECPNIATKL